ncbi:MAG: cardiolipin synthase [Pseudomonadota bacterium]
MLTGLIVSGFYLAGLLAALDAVMRTRTSTGAIAWAMVLVSVPFLAVPAYLVFGRNKFSGGIQAFEERQDEIIEVIRTFRDALTPWRTESSARAEDFLAIRRLVTVEMTRANAVELLINGEATFDSILAGVAKARDYILFQFYMFHDDGIGGRVKEALQDRARAGVRVYVLYDEVGSSGLPRAYVNDLRAAGVEVSAFRPTRDSGNRFQLNFRNHRKMVVVDGTVGWVGGHNVGDEYLGRDPDFSPWRDTHVRLEGPVVLQLQATILGDWYWATRELVTVSWTPVPAPEDADVSAMIVPFGPTQRLETAGLFFVTALHAAQQRIWLSAPYFVPDEAVMKALELAALRGVDVRIITTGKPDSWPVFLAAFHYINQLRDLGIRFYAYAPGFLHEKVVLIDDCFSSVGTPNFDNRSFRLNFEVTALIEDETFAAKMERMFEEDFAHSEPINPMALERKPFWWRLAVQLSRLAAPVL